METSFNKENIIGHVYQNLEIFTCLKIPVSLDNKKTGPYKVNAKKYVVVMETAELITEIIIAG